MPEQEFRPARVGDLNDMNDGVIALCNACGAECSARRGDYWSLSPDQTLDCCDEPCVLARRVSRMVPA